MWGKGPPPTVSLKVTYRLFIVGFVSIWSLKNKKMDAQLMGESPPGAISAVTPCGWIDRETHLAWLKYFWSVSNCNKEKPQLLIVDGHHSHKLVAAIDFARDHEIHVVVLPPHCTHRLQLLDRAFLTHSKRLKQELYMTGLQPTLSSKPLCHTSLFL